MPRCVYTCPPSDSLHAESIWRIVDTLLSGEDGPPRKVKRGSPRRGDPRVCTYRPFYIHFNLNTTPSTRVRKEWSAFKESSDDRAYGWPARKSRSPASLKNCFVVLETLWNRFKEIASIDFYCLRIRFVEVDDVIRCVIQFRNDTMQDNLMRRKWSLYLKFKSVFRNSTVPKLLIKFLEFYERFLPSGFTYPVIKIIAGVNVTGLGCRMDRWFQRFIS